MSSQWNQELSSYVARIFKSNWMFRIKHSKTNHLLKTIDYKTNEQSAKYSNWNMQIEIYPGRVSACSYCFCFYVPS